MTNSHTKPTAAIRKLETRVVQACMSYPDVIEDNPWGHRAFKIRGKMFVVLASDASGLNLSLKLPQSGLMALNFPNVEPTGYGMGKSGWVTLSFQSADELPFNLLLEWIDESFRAIAPKRVAAQYETPRNTAPDGTRAAATSRGAARGAAKPTTAVTPRGAARSAAKPTTATSNARSTKAAASRIHTKAPTSAPKAPRPKTRSSQRAKAARASRSKTLTH